MNQLLIRFTHRPDVPAQVVQAKRVYVSVVLAQRRVPVHLVCQRIPREPDDGRATVAHAKNVGPFLPKPKDRFITTRPFVKVRFRVHDRQKIPLVVLPRNFIVAENLA